MSYVRQRKRGNLLRKEQEATKCKEDFSTALEMTVWGNGFISRSVQRICLESAIPVSSSRAKPSIFLAHRYSAVCETAEKGKPSAKGARKSRVQGRFLAALEMTVWGEIGLFHTAYNGYACKSLFPSRHPERSRGILLGHRYSVLCEIAENGKPLAKGARSTGVQERFLAALEMTVWGEWVYST